jgi:hypothetical protein
MIIVVVVVGFVDYGLVHVSIVVIDDVSTAPSAAPIAIP